MSLKAKKLSAFAVFKDRKASSLTDVQRASTGSSAKKGRAKTASANTTPTSSRDTSLISFSGQNSGKGRVKAELKKVKKLLRSGQKEKQRPSCLPDSALQSPLVGNLTNGSVRLKSLRPKGSVPNLAYQLPLKATPDVVRPRKPTLVTQGVGTALPTGRPPHGARQKSLPSVSSDSGVASTPESAKRQTKSGSNMQQLASGSDGSLILPELPPKLPPRPAGRNMKAGVSLEPAMFPDQTDIPPPRPSKRRRSDEMNTSSPEKVLTKAAAKKMRLKSPPLSPAVGQLRTEPLPAHPSELTSSLPYMHDSYDEAKRLFECLIHPVKPEKFFRELWEKKPLLVKRHMANYNEGWFSVAEFDKILRQDVLQFTKNIDVTTYENGKRETHNPVGRAYAPVVWDYYQNGCSVRLLNPQTYSRSVWKLLSILQEYFGSCVGANCYLTPPGTQGFAPHWDDIEAFILQLEGKKHWKLYGPRNDAETLPLHSSGNFTDADMGEPILDVILEAGDLLYFPRGTIHQGRTLDDSHSFHITVSCSQRNTWSDLLQKLVPQALEVATEEDVEFRRALPMDYLQHMGVAFSDSESAERQAFLRKIEHLMTKLLSYAPVDAAVDQMGKRFIQDSLPPVLTEVEKQCSVHGHGERWVSEKQRVTGGVELEPDTKVKVIRRGALRLVSEEDKVCVYHNLENARVYHGNDIQYLEITAEMAPAVEYLLKSYPEFVTVDSFPLDSVQERVELAAAMYDKGLLVTNLPLEPLSESESESEEGE